MESEQEALVEWEELDSKLLGSLSAGDVVETVSVFEHLSEEPLCLKTEKVSKKKDGVLITFSVWYFGVCIGQQVARITIPAKGEAKVIWVDVAASKKGRK